MVKRFKIELLCFVLVIARLHIHVGPKLEDTASNNRYYKIRYYDKYLDLYFLWTYRYSLKQTFYWLKRYWVFKFTCIAASRDIPEFARDVEGVVGGRFIL